MSVRKGSEAHFIFPSFESHVRMSLDSLPGMYITRTLRPLIDLILCSPGPSQRKRIPLNSHGWVDNGTLGH